MLSYIGWFDIDGAPHLCTNWKLSSCTIGHFPNGALFDDALFVICRTFPSHLVDATIISMYCGQSTVLCHVRWQNVQRTWPRTVECPQTTTDVPEIQVGLTVLKLFCWMFFFCSTKFNCAYIESSRFNKVLTG